MSIVGQRVHWYRNEHEKETKEQNGTGEVIHLTILERSMEALAVIQTPEGCFVVKPLILIKAVPVEGADYLERFTNFCGQDIAVDVLNHPDWFTPNGDLSELHPKHPDFTSTPISDTEVIVIDSEEERKLNPAWYNANGTRHKSHPHYDIPF